MSLKGVDRQLNKGFFYETAKIFSKRDRSGFTAEFSGVGLCGAMLRALRRQHADEHHGGGRS